MDPTLGGRMVRAVRVGQYPPRRSLYREGSALQGRLAIPLAEIRQVIGRARARPVTPVYSELSGLLQVRLHEALSGQRDPAEALSRAARERRVRRLPVTMLSTQESKVSRLSDGKHTLMDISDRAGLEFDLIKEAADALAEQELLKEIGTGDEWPH